MGVPKVGILQRFGDENLIALLLIESNDVIYEGNLLFVGLRA